MFRQVAEALLEDEKTKTLLVYMHEQDKENELQKHAIDSMKHERELQKSLNESMARSHTLELQVVKRDLEDARTQLAFLRNMLNAGGVVELVEEEIEKAQPSLQQKPRALKWQMALDMPQFSSLLQCIVGIRALMANNSHDAGKAIANLYQELSMRAGHGHPTVQEWHQSRKALDIDAAGLAPARARLVACLARYLGIKYIYNQTVHSTLTEEVEEEEEEVE